MESPTRAFLFNLEVRRGIVRTGQNGVDRASNTSYYEKLLQTLEGSTVKKFLLVTMIGLVLVMDLCGIVNELMKDEIKDVDHIKETTIAVYME